MSNFWARTITGFSMVFLILAALYFDRFFLAGVFLIIVLLGLVEFYTITETEYCSPQKLPGIILGVIFYLAISGFMLVQNSDAVIIPILFLLPVLFIPVIIEIYRKKDKPLVNLAVTIFGILYIAFPVALLNIMNDPIGGTILGRFPAFLTTYFIATWIYDTGAYLAGRSFGRHKFFERISPKKTWEGIIGGSVTALAATAGLSAISEGVRPENLMIITLLVIVAGTYGDLAESLFKRSLNLKDSGTILPGHGGILDRFDTIFVSAPFVFLYFLLLPIFLLK